MIDVNDLITRQEARGERAVFLHSQSPGKFPIVDDVGYLLNCENRSAIAAANASILGNLDLRDDRAANLLKVVCEHHFAMGVLRALREIGGIRPLDTPYAATLAAYREASGLEQAGRLPEARVLFDTIARQGDDEFRSGAAYHLARIEESLGNTAEARLWYQRCLHWNPGHRKAREALKLPHVFHEVRPKVFERSGWSGVPRILFVVFGALGDVINAFPTVEALRNRFPRSQIVWLTLPAFAPVALRSAAHRVETFEPRGVIPWDWANAEGFTHIFYPEPNASHDESQQSGLHVIPFIAMKCGVELSAHRARLTPDIEAVLQARAFLDRHALRPGKYITASHIGISSRYWPHSRLERTIHGLEVPLVLFGAAKDPPIRGAVACFGNSFETVTALIRSSACFIGPDSGVSWLATTTETPMGVFIDPLRRRQMNVGFKEILCNEKTNIEEWTIHEEPERVLDHIRYHIATYEQRELLEETSRQQLSN